MSRKKTFNLTNEESSTSKSVEKLYQPKKFRWCKFVVIPLLIGFILLLVLTNVDFTGKAYDKTWLLVEDYSMDIAGKSVNSENIGQIRSSRGLTCISSDNNCSLECRGGNVNNIYKQLEPLYPLCGGDMELGLYECTFPAGTMKSSFLQGNFRLRSLLIIDCNLSSIQAKAFQQVSVSNLKALNMTNTKLLLLSENTFEGLTVLETLNISNKLIGATFNGDSFLTPLAQSLKTLTIRQESTTFQILDPQVWLSGSSDMNTLEMIDFSDNYFADALTDQTFANLVHVISLSLANCSLTHLPSNLFDAMLNTLQHLDLSQNQFSTLDSALFVKLNGLNTLAMADNFWDCSCSNEEMLKGIQGKIDNITYDGENSMCNTPLELRQTTIFSVQLECEDEIITTESSGDDSTETYETPSGETNDSTTSKEIPTTASPSITKTSTTTTTTTPSYPSTTTTTTPSYTSTTTTTTTTPSYTSTTTTTTSTTTTTTPSYTLTTTTTTPSTGNTTPPELFILICCNKEQFHKALARTQSQFAITLQSETSVRVIVSQQTALNFNLIYFGNNTHVQEWTNGSVLASQNSVTLIVGNLMPATAYTFCLAFYNSKQVSPFDCKSYYVYIHEVEAWVMDEDKSWIIALVVLGVCLCLFLGIIVIFSLIRLKNRRKARKQRLKATILGNSHLNESTVVVSEVPLADLQIFLNANHDSPNSPHYIKPQNMYPQHSSLDYYEELEM